MAPVKRLDALCAAAPSPRRNEHASAEDLADLSDFEAELERLSAVNQELLNHVGNSPASDEGDDDASSPGDEVELLRLENSVLKARMEELEARASTGGEEGWLERQREYEMLLEEKSEVIRSLHQKIQELQESPMLGAVPMTAVSASGLGLGQAEEILRLKRELEDQRRQLEQDEEDMMTQMRQMELTMAKERAEMARQRQEVQRLQAELAREIERSSKAPELRERLNTLRRQSDPKLATPAPESADAPTSGSQKKSSGLLRRLFG